MSLTTSSIWDSATGFGGDGDPALNLTVGGGRCVTTGPFSGLRPIKYNHTYVQHCLSRGFQNEIGPGILSGEPFKPEAIGRIARISTYEQFVKSVERDLHAPIHLSVRGDLFAMTGANGEKGRRTLLDGVPGIDVNMQIPSSSCTTHNSTVCGGNGSRKTLRSD